MKPNVYQSPHNACKGFTLIELSIVIVITGLVVAGVLVGQGLIKAATIRAQISQIEKYQTAVNTFRLKYGNLPGDIPNTNAIAFGFTNSSYRNGNGIIVGTSAYSPQYQNGGETNLFWVDLGQSGLIGGKFTYNTNSNMSVSGDDVSQYLPRAELGNGKYVYVWSGGPNVYSCGGCFGSTTHDGKNYFALTAVPIFRAYNVGGGYTGISGAVNTIAIIDAYNIDVKIDDGLPNSGNVFAYYASSGGFANPFTTAATPASATTCFDNGNIAGAIKRYSLSQNGGNGTNCALNFRFQ